MSRFLNKLSTDNIDQIEPAIRRKSIKIVNNCDFDRVLFSRNFDHIFDDESKTEWTDWEDINGSII